MVPIVQRETAIRKGDHPYHQIHDSIKPLGNEMQPSGRRFFYITLEIWILDKCVSHAQILPGRLLG